VLSIGIVGTGAMAEYQASRFAALPGVKVAACCDRQPGRAALFARERGIEGVFVDPGAMAASGMVQAVSVASADGWHREPVLAVLSRGLPVLCEKPMARTLAGAREMAAAARAARVPALVNFSKRNGGALSLAGRLLREGRAGAPRSAALSYLQGWLADGAWGDWRDTPRLRWRLLEGSSTFGALGDLGAHLLDALLLVLGGAEAVACLARRFDPRPFGEGAYESFEALLDSGGLPVAVSGSFRAAGQADRFAMSLRCERACIELDLSASRRSVRIVGGAAGTGEEVSAPPSPTSYERFAALASGGEDPLAAEPIGFDEALRVQELLDGCAALARAREGTPLA